MANQKKIQHVGQIPIDITDDQGIERDLMQEECEDVSSSSNKRPHRLANQRRKIRKIRDDSELAEETKQAQAIERERRERSRLIVGEHILGTAENKLESDIKKTKAQRSSTSCAPDVIIIGESDDSDSELSVIGEVPASKIATSPTVIDCTGVLSMDKNFETMDSVTELDLESTQLHLNDKLNVPDKQGQVLVNVFHPPGDPDVFVLDHLVKALKPHQIGGIRFLYSNIIERLTDFNIDSGFGCILAHCMGLGKTLQVITFIDVFLQYTPCSRVLCVVPINTLQNWQDEFDKWLPRHGGLWTVPVDVPELISRCSTSLPQQVRILVPQCQFKVFVFDEKLKDLPSRAEMIHDWYITGGVLIIGYEMYRMLALQVPTMSGVRRLEGKKMTKPKAGKQGNQFIDLEAEEEQMRKLQAIQSMLCDPGPDLVVCDEGHRIKNVVAGISQALKKIRTKRRIVLTGYPLQNNLSEYWCMIDFVRPNFLGSHQDFVNMFEYPIYNGQCVDSTQRVC
jgi:RAD54-like protein 2